jgi:hypothetical protein
MTEKPMAVGITTAKAPAPGWRSVQKIATPSSRFQPRWRLGMAAQWLTKAAGCIS